jgi:hypothetical protein
MVSGRFGILSVLALVAMAFAQSATAAISYVQGNSSASSASRSTITVTYQAAQNAGDLNVVAIGWSNRAATIRSVTDTKGNTYALAVGPTATGTQAIYYAKNVQAATAGSNTVTVTLSTSAPWTDVRIVEYGGIDTTSPLDGAVAASGTGTITSSGPLTTTNAHNLLFAANYVGGTSTGPGPGYTQRLNPSGDIVQDQIVSATGTYTATAPQDSNSSYIMQLVAFRAAAGTTNPGGGGGGGPVGGAPIAYVQGASSALSATRSTVSVTYSKAQNAGDLNVVAVGWATAGVTVRSVTDSMGNIYAQAVGSTPAGQQAIYYVPNVQAAAAGANTVTVTLSGASAWTDVRIAEYSGIDIANPLDVTASSNGTGTLTDSGSLTTSSQTALLFAANYVGGTTTGPGAGYTQRLNPAGDIVQDRIVSAAGVYSATAPQDSSKKWVMQLVAFRGAPGAGTSDTEPPSKPSGLGATAMSSSQINLQWGASTDNVAVTGYSIERCTGSTCTNFAAVASTTNTTYSDTGLSASASYGYRVRAKDAANLLSQPSDPARATTMSGASGPSITSQPANRTVTEGATASFSVTATGTAPLSYQWRRGGNNIAGATASTYTTPATTSSDNGATFSVVVSNSVSSVTSNNATLTVHSVAVAPTITSQPSNRSVTVGATATFSVLATGTAPLSYQWRKGGTPISGATGSSYTTPPTTSGDSGSVFSVIVSNSVGSTPSNNATLTVTSVARGALDYTTYKRDNARTGATTTETVLTPANVNSSRFGLLRKLTVDGKVDAQPLYLHQLVINGTSRNVVYVATEHDSVYAFDADTGAQLWRVSLLPAGESLSDTHGCDQVTPEIGITSTPVIDRDAGANGAIYVVAMSRSGSTYHQRLHALDLTTGAPILAAREITATYSGSGGSTTFDPKQYEERAALLLVNGVIYTSWTSHCDQPPYTGWVIAFDQSTLQRRAAIDLAVGRGGVGPAIWMAGGGPAADEAGNVYLLTANGAFETTLVNGFPSKGDYGNSFVKLTLNGSTLSVSDYFALSNTVAASAADRDLGSGGGMLLPDFTDSGGVTRRLMVGAGKDGNLYVVNRDSMGHFSSSANNIWQQLNGALGPVFSTPAYFNGTLYYGSVSAPIRAFRITNARLSSSPVATTSNTFFYPGTSPVVSANGTSNGIVWAHDNLSNAGLRAYEAGSLDELYNSDITTPSGRDRFGAGNKFITPTVIDGKVFVGSQNAVGVFGILP